MKKIFLFLLICLVVVACFVSYTFHRVLHFNNDHDVSIKIKETGSMYQLYASYQRNKTYRVQRFMDAQLHTHDLFRNARMNAVVTLDDKTNFYIKTSPGSLYIKLNKDENNDEAYLRIKELGEQIKQKLANNE